MTTFSHDDTPAVWRGSADRQLTVKYEFVIVDGDAAKPLMARQAAAVRAALEYFARHGNTSGPVGQAKTEAASARSQGDDLFDLE